MPTSWRARRRSPTRPPDNSASQNIQPGAYDLHQHQSGKNALTALLDPSSRNAANDVLVTEGANMYAVQARLVKVLGSDSKAAIADRADQAGRPRPAGDVRGQRQGTDVGRGIPLPRDVHDRSRHEAAGRAERDGHALHPGRPHSGFAAAAKAAGLTPYEALTVASIIQAEAKFDEDMPKVAEVIYNRLKAKTALQIDATTKYGCEIAGETHCIYNNFPSPYNSYLHDRAAADADRQSRCAGDGCRRAPGDRRVQVLRQR